MTTPPTPAGWYPDPEQAGQLRYWDGGNWTEHRTPEQAAADEPSATAEAAQPGGDHVGAHRAPDGEPESTPEPDHDPLPVTEQPTTRVPLREWSFEPPPLEPDAATHAFSLEPTTTPEPPSTPEARSTQEPSREPTPVPLTDQPTTKVPLRDWTAEPKPEPAPYADATTPTADEPPAVEPPVGTEPPGPVDNRKLIMGFGGAVAALLLVLILAAVYAFVIHKDNKTQQSAPRTSQSSTATSKDTTPSEAPPSTEAATPPPGTGAVDGPLTFTVTGTDSGTTVTDPNNDFLTKDAQGEFIVVHLTVANTSQDPGQFLGTLQKLKAGGQVYNIDDEATFYVGGGFVDVPAGGQVDVGLAYDVPQGTVPDTIELHADPTTPGVELPIG
jgi:hypothetical protein